MTIEPIMDALKLQDVLRRMVYEQHGEHVFGLQGKKKLI